MLERISICLMMAWLGPMAAVAEDAAQPPPPPKWYDTFELHGLVDTYYSANLDQSQRAPSALRVFDVTNGFELSYAKVTALLAPPRAYTPGFRVDVGLGQTASVLMFKSSISSADVVVQQAFVSYKLPGDLVIDAGKFVTNAGAEVIEAKDDWLYSRSLLFGFAIPFTHTGVRATIPVPGVSGLSAMAAVFNGWDNPPKAVGPEKMGHLALSYAGPPGTTLTLNVLYGRNPYENDDRLLVDGIVARSFGRLSLNVSGDYGRLGGASYWGVSGMARLALAGGRLRISGRGEYLDDSDGIQVAPPAGNRYSEWTLGLSVPLGSSAELRVEGRQDRIDAGVLPDGKGHQTTVQAAALAWF